MGKNDDRDDPREMLRDPTTFFILFRTIYPAIAPANTPPPRRPLVSSFASLARQQPLFFNIFARRWSEGKRTHGLERTLFDSQKKQTSSFSLVPTLQYHRHSLTQPPRTLTLCPLTLSCAHFHLKAMDSKMYWKLRNDPTLSLSLSVSLALLSIL